MPPVPPFWFKQRQCKAEPVTGTAPQEQLLKVTGPNLIEAYVYIRPGEDKVWRVGVRFHAEGPDVATAAAEEATEQEAWDAAFELYRTHLIV